MDRFVYISANNSQQLMDAQTINIHNLANVNTPGFRADFAHFHAAAVSGDGLDSIAYSSLGSIASDFKAGAISATNRDLDIAIQNEGFISVQGKDGKEALTRAGNLMIDAKGMLVTSSGQPVLGNGGPITIPPSEQIEIAEDGTISVRPQGQGPASLAQLDRIKLVKPNTEDLQKGLDGLFYSKNDTAFAADSSVKIQSGALEGSNVDAVGTMVQIMELAREYEVQSKMMKAAEDNSQTSAQIMHVA